MFCEIPRAKYWKWTMILVRSFALKSKSVGAAPTARKYESQGQARSASPLVSNKKFDVSTESAKYQC